MTNINIDRINDIFKDRESTSIQPMKKAGLYNFSS